MGGEKGEDGENLRECDGWDEGGVDVGAGKGAWSGTTSTQEDMQSFN